MKRTYISNRLICLFFGHIWKGAFDMRAMIHKVVCKRCGKERVFKKQECLCERCVSDRRDEARDIAKFKFGNDI